MRVVSDGLRDLRLQPGRAVLAAVSLLLGVLAVIGNGLATTISREIVVASSEQRTAKSVTYQQQLNGNITVSTVERLTLEASRLRIDHNGGSWALLGSPARTAAGKGTSPDKAQYSGLEMAVTAGDLPSVRRLPILSGDWLSDGIYPPEVVLNKAAAERFGGVGTMLQAVVSPLEDPIAVTVVGVVADAAERGMGYLSLKMVVSLRSSVMLNGLSVLVRYPARVAALAADNADALLASVEGSVGAPPTRIDQGEELAKQLRQLESMLRIVALAALILALLGMANIGLATVRERARELVVRRAVGARRIDLFGQVLAGSMLLGLITTAIAVTIALTINTLVLPGLIDPVTAIDPPAFPWSTALYATAAALITTMLAGLLPAFRAARLDIATALRD